MKLYLHCGYHKTGSSFLQTLFARNRKLLEDHGFFFPEGNKDEDMLKGNISAGNGWLLSEYLKNKEQAEVTEYLKKDLKKPKK